jgi:hypothetical protein
MSWLSEVLHQVSWSSAGGVLFGAAISASVSYALQRTSFAEARRQKEKDRYEVRRVQAYSLFFKMIRMHSNLAIIDATLADFIQKGRAKGMSAYWQMILPLGNMPDKVKFTAEEMALLLSLDIKLFNDLGPYDDVHNGLLGLYESYSAKRAVALSKFGTLEMDGGTGTHDLSAEDVAWLTPRAYEMHTLAEGMIQRAKEERATSTNLLERIHALFVREFKFEPKLEFIEPTV